MFLVMLLLPLLFLVAANALHAPSRPQLHGNVSYYSHAHSYGSSYTFGKRDGWETVQISNFSYKYVQNNATHDASGNRDILDKLERRSRMGKQKSQKNQKSHGNSFRDTFQHVVDATLKGIGKIEQVTITWYTGNDLKNPSCWEKTVWTPSDDSFACALTLEGWTDRPKCFEFLELCNGPNKCVFVRVVDTCAGCPSGTKHVDLTKAAFQAIAALDQGILQVNMRLATAPQEWHENLWGPKEFSSLMSPV